MKASATAGRFIALLIVAALGLAAFLWIMSVIVSSIPSTGPVLHPLILVSKTGVDTTLQVEWAVTPQERETGLMNRTQVDHGMLFIFDSNQQLTFWMKNTLVPLDIIFFDAHGSYVSSAHMTPCTADPCPLYSSKNAATYALEMPAGFIDREHVDAGWSMRP